jgi:hypothetical protein
MSYLELLRAPESIALEAIEFANELGMYRSWLAKSRGPK